MHYKQHDNFRGRYLMRSNIINLVKIDVHVDKTDLHVCTKCHADSASKSCCQKVVFFLKQNL